MDDDSIGRSLSNMQKDGQISENDLEEMTKRLAVGEELKASLAAKEAGENGSNPSSDGKKKGKAE
tara:strand:+ start:711 stop:905 length:195 start_codon:yes stop_codon:yes gene_type:complete